MFQKISTYVYALLKSFTSSNLPYLIKKMLKDLDKYLDVHWIISHKNDWEMETA